MSGRLFSFLKTVWTTKTTWLRGLTVILLYTQKQNPDVGTNTPRLGPRRQTARNKTDNSIKLRGVTEEGKAPWTRDCGLWVPTVSDTIWQMDQSTPGLSPAKSWGSHDRWISANPTDRGRTFGCISTHASLSLPFKQYFHLFPSFPSFACDCNHKAQKMRDQCGFFPPKYFLKSSLFWGTRRCFRETQSCAYEEDPTPLSTHVPFRPKPRQLSALLQVPISAERRIWLRSSTAKMSCCQILPRALRAMLNSHPSGSGDQKKYGAHALLRAHGFRLQLLQLLGHPLSYPWTKPKHPYFCRNPPLSCTAHQIGAEETWRVANVMLANRSKWRHLTAECFLVSNYHFCINRGRKNASVDAMNNCGIFPKGLIEIFNHTKKAQPYSTHTCKNTFCMCMRAQQAQTVRGAAHQDCCDSVTKLRLVDTYVISTTFSQSKCASNNEHHFLIQDIYGLIKTQHFQICRAKFDS